ncbi:hypothetical protein BFW38_12340 [Terasakiispira papahanaumokuakeensis]|uniref:Uncharacterized protein n=1 Tax=Terasakiispira papahanaumokuakeensis TaxID=197479 RepID=A0A1E2VB50_9GAMM|nr:hypothetical protein [Terasakiispira papahanaumokuakeensis]ODC04201.1 hypothetical protein BFW38_12340 [Terasakiispira papahanaumokuakeensis]
MKLPDFTEFEPFVALRQQMGARRQGHFELFDPKRHLNGRERSALETTGLKRSLSQLRALADGTWAIKNSRILIYSAHTPGHYHLAQCPSLLTQKRQEVVITTRRQGQIPGFTEDVTAQVCSDCLQLLGYKGFDLTRNRKIAYSKALLKDFSREDFFKVFTLYPVRGIAEHTLTESPLTQSNHQASGDA